MGHVYPSVARGNVQENPGFKVNIPEVARKAELIQKEGTATAPRATASARASFLQSSVAIACV